MLDLRMWSGTPGATTTNTLLATLPNTDGSTVVGVPVGTDARLILWGSSSLIANTICSTNLISQDGVDPINGELVRLGTTSLKNLFHKFTNIPHKTGARRIGQGTNTAQTATSMAFTLDEYEGIGETVGADKLFSPNQIALPQVAGQADVAVQWSPTAFAPATQIPLGKYGILGFYLSTSTEAHLIRFAHADFKGLEPGLPCIDHFEDAIHGHQKGMMDILHTSPGYQFSELSRISGKSLIPCFHVTNSGTGLTIKSAAGATTDTPIVTVNLAKLD